MIDKQALSTPRQIGVMPVIVLDTLGTTGLIWGAQTACAPTRVHRQTMITLGTICPRPRHQAGEVLSLIHI